MSLIESFNEHLEGLSADTPELAQEAYRLRYHVYCEERGFEDPSRFPDCLEHDAFDPRSIQALVRHRKSGWPAGVVRLVLPDLNAPETPFPIELHCGDRFDQAAMKRFRVPRSQIAEVSRFAVVREFKRRDGEAAMVAGVSPSLDYLEPAPEDTRRFFPHISLGLIAMLFVISANRGITHWYAVMEPSLSRLLTRFGIQFVPIGPLVDYHGRRQPMMASVDDLLDGVARTRPDFRALITSMGGAPDPQDDRSDHRATG